MEDFPEFMKNHANRIAMMDQGIERQGHPELMLMLLKTIHTVIWAIMASANVTAFYLAFVGQFNIGFFVAVTLLGGEIIVILINSGRCPLTKVMAEYTDQRQANFDIYLPKWLAKNNIKGFAILMILEILIVLVRRLGT